MFTEQDLKTLIEFDSRGHAVLSVYLNVDPTTRTSEAYKIRLRGLLKQSEDGVAAADIAAIEKYFDHQYDWSGRTVAVFSCAPLDFFRAYSLAVAARSRARVMPRPYVKPLADLMDSYGNYGVALVDKQGARLFHFHLGELREQEGTFGEAVKHTKRGGASTVPGRRGGAAGRTRHEDEKVARNLREAVDFAVSFFNDQGIRRILLGGTDENVAQFRAMLPKAWQKRVVGALAIGMNAGEAEVLARSLEVAQAAERAREGKIIQTLITAAAKGKAGVVRLDDTLGAAHAGQIQTLVISEGFRAPGWQCVGCGFVTSQRLVRCPFCGHSFAEIPDAVEHTIHKVMRDGGEVEVVRGNPALDSVGRIGALLRY